MKPGPVLEEDWNRIRELYKQARFHSNKSWECFNEILDITNSGTDLEDGSVALCSIINDQKDIDFELAMKRLGFYPVKSPLT